MTLFRRLRSGLCLPLFLSTVAAAQTAPANVAVSTPTPELAPIVISAAPQPTDSLSTPASVSVVQGRELDKNRGQSVMSAIQDEPGISMVDEGPTVVKPVIRGLNSQEIVVAKDGVREDFIQWGNEHAPEIDSLGADSIEIVRGPNSLLYGSDALGGVISINSPALASAAAGAGPLSGKLSAEVNSVNDEVGEGAQIAGASGDWGYRMNLDQKQSGDFRNPEGLVNNTGEREYSGDGAVGVTKDWGSVVLDYSHFYKNVQLQNPSNPYPAPYDDLEYQVLVHDNAGLHANVNTGAGRLELITGYDQSNRNEFDNPTTPEDDPHLHWIQTTVSQDVRLHMLPLGPLQGTVGVSAYDQHEQSLSVLPNEPFADITTGQAITQLTPPYYENGVAGYVYEELPLDRFTFSGGVRGDQTQYNITAAPNIGIDPDYRLDDPHPVAAQTLNYSAISAALGAVYHITEPLALAVNLGRAYRNPDPFELFGYGVHEGAGVFQIGNPNLTPETSFNMDTSLRWSSPGFKLEVGAFQNYIHNYIYGAYNGVVQQPTGLQEVVETQGDALIQGTDMAASGAVLDWLTLNGGFSIVRGENLGTQNNLPKIPADNYRVGAEVHEKGWGPIDNPYFGTTVKFTLSQDRTSPNEIRTGGYSLVGLKTGGEFLVANNRITLDAGVDNLLNKGYIDYDSILKEFNIENSGRNLYVRVSVPFGS